MGSNERTYGKCLETDMDSLKLLKDWCIEVNVKKSRLGIKTVKNTKLGDEYVTGSKGKHCVITMNNKGEVLENYRIVVCITGKR